VSKIVSAVNAMVLSQEKIKPVLLGISGEYFFMYDGKYKWSMKKDSDGEVWLWYYPGALTLEQLSGIDGDEWDRVSMVIYRTSEIPGREAMQSFNELFSILKEKVYGMDEVLKDIIGDDDIPF
jgi:hypothetical protein